MVINKKKEKLPSYGFCHSNKLQSENERKWQNRQIIGPCQKKKQTIKHAGDGDNNYSWCTWNGLQKLGKETRTIGNQRKNRDYSKIEIGQNSKMSSRDLRRLQWKSTGWLCVKNSPWVLIKGQLY